MTIEQRFLIHSGSGNVKGEHSEHCMKKCSCESARSIKSLKEQSRVCPGPAVVGAALREPLQQPGAALQVDQTSWRSDGAGGCAWRMGLLALEQRMELALWCLHLPSLRCCGPREHHVLSKRHMTENSLYDPHGTALRPHVAQSLHYGNICWKHTPR